MPLVVVEPYLLGAGLERPLAAGMTNEDVVEQKARPTTVARALTRCILQQSSKFVRSSTVERLVLSCLDLYPRWRTHKTEAACVVYDVDGVLLLAELFAIKTVCSHGLSGKSLREMDRIRKARDGLMKLRSADDDVHDRSKTLDDHV